jgi:hypothetical protein
MGNYYSSKYYGSGESQEDAFTSLITNMKYHNCTNIFPEKYLLYGVDDIQFVYKNIEYKTKITYEYKRNICYAYIFHSGWQKISDNKV